MIEPLGFAAAAARARVIASALALGRSLDLWSLVLLALALLSLLALPVPLLPKICLLVSLLAAGGQKILALRVAFDAALFHHWAERWCSAAAQDPASTVLAADLAELDQALASCGLRAPPVGAGRDLESRLRGARRLLKGQALALAVQCAALIAAGLAIPLGTAG